MFRFRARQGFTLLELAFAGCLFAIVIAGVMAGFMGMRRAQGVSVSHNLLKASSQKALRTMYMELSQSRKLLASSKLDPLTQDLGRDYFTRFGGITAPPSVPFGNLVFPRVDPNGGFGLVGPGAGELTQSCIGNTLVFLAGGDRLKVATPLTSILYGTPPTVQVLSNTPYFLSSYRFIAYYMAEVPLPPGVAPIKVSGTSTKAYTQQLRRWESQTYLEKGEFEELVSKMLAVSTQSATTTLAVWNWLVTTYNVAGLWDGGAASAATAFYTVDSSGAIVAVANPTVARRRETRAVDTSASGYAVGMVAFNSNAFDYKFPDFTVPAYAPTDAAHVNFPYGFEVGICGPTGARSVLIRLALASRVNSGMHLFGIAQQEVVKALDM